MIKRKIILLVFTMFTVCAQVFAQEKNVVVFHNNGFSGKSMAALTTDDKNPCRLIDTDDQNLYQQWELISTGDGYYFLKNIGREDASSVKQFLVQSEVESKNGNVDIWSFTFQDATYRDDHLDEAKYELSNDGDVLYIRLKKNSDKYVGTNNATSVEVYADKAKSVVTTKWTLSAPQPVISFSEGTFNITCANTSATIYYTTDGTDPKDSATKKTFSSSFSLSPGETKVRAVAKIGIAVKDGTYESYSKESIYNTIICENPVITNTSGTIAITCATPEADIYYTTDGKEPTLSSTLYKDPLKLDLTTTVSSIKAIAMIDNDETTKSEIVELSITKNSTPSVSRSLADGKVTMTCSTTGVTIRYTTDGTTPNTSSTLYSAPITLLPENNNIEQIRAIAYLAGNRPSDIKIVNVPRCKEPEINITGGMVTITCSSPGATIYYQATGNYVRYTDPFSLGSLTYIRAYSACMGYCNSNVATYEAPTEVSSSSLITNMSGSYLLAEGFVVDTSIGTAEKPFRGKIDGQYHVISNVSTPLIAYADGAVIRNVTLDNVSIGGGDNTGAICNEARGATIIYNCGVQGGSISGSGYVGSMAGLLDGKSRVINCYSFANISGGSDVGGIVGYNNIASTTDNLQTMVMNCMYYGDEISGTRVSPIYGGQIIASNYTSATNAGINNFNYFRQETTMSGTIVYNCALAMEERYLNRFEFYRLMLNSNRELAAWYVSNSFDDARLLMGKWVLETADRTNTHPKPYPILKPQGSYPSMVNIDAEHAEDMGAGADETVTDPNRNKGGKLGTLSVTIAAGTGGARFAPPTGASITTSSLSLNITDKDEVRHNYCYRKVQLPYYNDVGTGNYTDNRVVTGWKITSINGGGTTHYTTGEDATTDGEGNITATPYNFADRNCTEKDLYDVSGRIFSQGAYWDVPNGVTAITIEPYWAKCTYLSDPKYDVTYNSTYGNRTDFGPAGVRYDNNNSYTINGSSQKVFTTHGNALSDLERDASNTVYDYAVVLVGNYHIYLGGTSFSEDNKPFTLMSVDLDRDNEPDYSFIYQQGDQRRPISPIRFDFLNWIGLGMAQKANGSLRLPGIGLFQPKGWFEVTNTCVCRFTEFEYDYSGKTSAPLILLGGICEQIVSTNNTDSPTRTPYIHVGGGAWFKMFSNGVHQDKKFFTPHHPISVTGGDFDRFYLSGMFIPDANVEEDHAECYISGGRFGELAGSGMEQISGNVTWQIYGADITNFYGGGINAAKPVKGNIRTDISHSHIGMFCGGPKFGDMDPGKTVTTTASNCWFGRFFGAGYGGTSLNRWADTKNANKTNQANYNFNSWVTSDYDRKYNSDAAKNGIAVSFEYELFAWAGFGSNTNVGRFYVNYASLSLAQAHNVTTTLSDCKIAENFYGGGNLGKVDGNILSTLTNCKVGGNVYGAGFSAKAPTCDVYPATTRYATGTPTGNTFGPYWDGNAGIYYEGRLTEEPVTYTWHQVESVSKNNEFDEVNHFIYTTTDMTGLGTVTGDATLNINGTTSVDGNVFGGGDESHVLGNANVTITDNSSVLGNVYGGGNVGTVGTFTPLDWSTHTAYHSTHPEAPEGKPHLCEANKGKTTVVISGAAIVGPDNMTMPDDAGMVFGAGRGTVDPLYDDPTYKDLPITNDSKQSAIAALSDEDLTLKLNALEKLAYVNETEVVIGGTAFIKGSVYGGSENGHVLSDTKVQITEDCQIGNGEGKNRRYTAEEWTSENANNFTECAHWPYEGTHSVHDIFADRYDASLDTWKKMANGAVNATDGHTFYGNVFGGGSGYYPYAPGRWLRSAGLVEGSTVVDITGGHILTSAYGGNEMTDVYGSCTVTMSGGTLGVPRTKADMIAHPVTCYLFGAGKGDERTWANTWTNVASASVTVSGPARIFGSIFGGGEDGHVLGDVITTVKPDDMDKTKAPLIGTTGTSSVDGNVFGGGRGFAENALTAGVVCGNTTVNISGGTMLGSVFGGGRLASVGTHLASPEHANYGVMIPDGKKMVINGADIDSPGETHGNITVNITGGTIGATDSSGELYESNFTIGEVFAGCKGSTRNDTHALQLGLSKNNTLHISQADDDVPTIIHSSVYGGGEAGNVLGTVSVTMDGGSIHDDVYGGGALADTNHDGGNTTVTLRGGTVGRNVYGGGLGRKAVDEITGIDAIVGGNVTVELNPTPTKTGDVPDFPDNCVVKGSIFGCNNQNGSPRGDVTVHVYKTVGWEGHHRTATEMLDAAGDESHHYEVEAVYGGGNLAPYQPFGPAANDTEADFKATTKKTHVIIDGCDLTSIRQVYGGGNAASTPECLVDINGTYEIEEVFGGGNGKDEIVIGDRSLANPGANVGYYDYSAYEDSEDASHGAKTKELRMANYSYGSGQSNVNIHGGKVHRVYGGSNTKGNVRVTAVTMLEDESGCPFDVDEAYGGGKSAPMDGTAKLEMACIPGLRAAYGGAEDAEIEGNVELTITNGTYDRVFGGNNVSGHIKGTITVNIEETGCKPIIIGQLYGGGNQAPYAAPAGEHGPTLNVRSFTSIGEVYGGGYGKTAVVTGDTYVNINVSKGKYATGAYADALYTYADGSKVNDAGNGKTGSKTIHFTEYQRTEEGDFIYDEDGVTRLAQNRDVEIFLPPFTAGHIGGINKVFGGGNAAEVRGDTNISIGTESSQVFVTPKTKIVAEEEVETTVLERTHTVEGANIIGDVYGGGNQANVTGSTHVTVGED